MNRLILSGILFLFALLPNCAFAAPRDATAVLNRCGRPLKGETTILENTVAGGRRILSYERGALHFDKVANIGWTFTYGTHKGQDHLTAEQMERYMPCLKDALADSAAPEPLVTVTPIQRVEVSMKRSMMTLILYTLGGLVVFGLCLLAYSYTRKDPALEDE
jgi:hypothetical protein